MDNKKFIEALSSRLDISVSSVNILIESLNKEISTSIINLDSVVVPGFGIFESKLREERVALHPASGKRLLVPPRMFISFKQSPVLKQKINNGK